MYYETDLNGNLLRSLPGYYDGYYADLVGVDVNILSDTQKDYLSIDPSRIVVVEDSEHELFVCKTTAIQEVSQKCVDANYKIFPWHKRDNVYSGADEGYPVYLKGELGKQSIAKLNKMYRDIANNAIAAIQAASTVEDVIAIVSSIVLPSESNIIALIEQ